MTGGTEDVLKIRARGAQGGGESEDDAGEEGDGEGEEQNARIDGDIGGARKFRGQRNGDGFGGGEGEGESREAACAGEEKALGE